MRQERESRIAPVQIGDRVTERIVGRGKEGEGDAVIKVKGFVIFVPTSKQEGETINVEITRILSKFGFGVELEDSELNTSID